MKKILTLAAVLAAFLMASPAKAVTVTYDFTLFPDADQPTPISSVPPSPLFFEDVEGSTGLRKTPYQANETGHAPLCEECNYNSVNGGGGVAIYNIGATENQTLAMMWGSPDEEIDRNRMDFFAGANGVGLPIFTIQGSSVVAWLLANGPVGSAAGEGFVTVYITGLNFASIMLSDTTQYAFEHVFRASNQIVTENVPLPAGLLLLLSGLVGLGFMARVRAKSA